MFALILGISGVLSIATPSAARAQDRDGGEAPSQPSIATESVAEAEPIVRSIRASGFVNVDSVVVTRTFGLHVGDAFDPRAVADGVRRLFASGLYLDVVVRDSPVSDGVALEVAVTERQRIQSIEFEGMKKLEESAIRSKLTVAQGQLLDPGTLDVDARKIADAYAEEGYARAHVSPRVEIVGPGVAKVTFAIREGGKLKVRDIQVHGNATVRAKEVRKAMKSRTPGFLRSGTYKPSQLEQDEAQVRIYLRSRGFKDADVDSMRAEEIAGGMGVVLHVYVREGPYYTFGPATWSGNVSVPTEALEIATTIRPGRPYSEPQVQETLEGAYTLYQEKGYLFLGIEPKFTEVDSTVSVEFQVQEGFRSRVTDLKIVGNTRTRENVIRREAIVRPGDIFRRSALMRTQRDIFGLGYFQDVLVDYEPTGDSADIALTLRVKEKQTGTASAGAGYSSQTGVTGFLEFGHNNLFGRGQNVSLRLERGGRRSNVEVSYTEPWFRDTPLSVGFDVFNTRRELDFYDRKDIGGTFRLGRPLAWPDYTRGYVAYELRDVTLTNVKPEQPGEPSNLASLRSIEGDRRRVSSVTLTFNRNSTDNPFYPARGSRLTWSSELAGGPLGGVERFYKEIVEARNYSRLTGPFTLMLRGKAGFLGGGRVPEYERFRLGGTTVDYLRGYPDYYVVPRANIVRDSRGRILDRYPGGRTMLIVTSEIQFPIADPLRGLLFFEGGNTWNSTRDLDLGDFRESVGFGFRLEVPALGRIGIDFGYGLDREEGASWETHFQLGNTF